MLPSQEVTTLRKAKLLEEAYQKAHELLQQHQGDQYLKISLGWVLHDMIKKIAETHKLDKRSASLGQAYNEEIKKLLLEYAQLKLPRPDLLFSRILFQVLSISSNLNFLPAFMVWAGLSCFRMEDLCVSTGQDGKVYESLIEKAARVTAKSARDSVKAHIKEFAVALLDEAIAKGVVQKLIWLHYNKALLLGELGRTKEAQDLLLPIVRQKRSEFWAWHALGKMKEEAESELALALYAKAWLAVDDTRSKFGVGVLEDLGSLSARHELPGLAKWAVDKAIAIRRENGWGQSQSLRDLINAAWYRNASDLSDPDKALTDCARGAERIIYADCPLYEATYLGTFKAKSGKLMLKVALRSAGDAKEYVSPARGLIDVSTYHVGEAVNVRIFEENEYSNIVEINRRETGGQFDCLIKVSGIIDHQNQDKKLASVYLTATKFCLLPYQEFPSVEAWAPGTSVAICCTESEGRLKPYYTEQTKFHETDWVKRIVGEISVHPKGFAFVNDVFVPPPLAQAYKSGQEVTLVAVRKFKKNSDEIRWTAIGPIGAIIFELDLYRKFG